MASHTNAVFIRKGPFGKPYNDLGAPATSIFMERITCVSAVVNGANLPGLTSQGLTSLWWHALRTLTALIGRCGCDLKSVNEFTKKTIMPTFIITGGIAGGCHQDNLQCHQWWQCLHYNNSWFSVFQTQIKDGYFEHFLWNCPEMNARRHHWWLVHFVLSCLGNGLVP